MEGGSRAAALQIARERIRAATLALVERHGLDDHLATMALADAAPISVRDLRQLEATAVLLEGLVAVAAPQVKTAAKAPPADAKPAKRSA